MTKGTKPEGTHRGPGTDARWRRGLPLSENGPLIFKYLRRRAEGATEKQKPGLSGVRSPCYLAVFLHTLMLSRCVGGCPGNPEDPDGELRKGTQITCPWPVGPAEQEAGLGRWIPRGSLLGTPIWGSGPLLQVHFHRMWLLISGQCNGTDPISRYQGTKAKGTRALFQSPGVGGAPWAVVTVTAGAIPTLLRPVPLACRPPREKPNGSEYVRHGWYAAAFSTCDR